MSAGWAGVHSVYALMNVYDDHLMVEGQGRCELRQI